MVFVTILLSIIAIVIAINYYLSYRGPNIFREHGIPHIEPKSFLRQVMEIFVFPNDFITMVDEMYHSKAEGKYIGFFNFSEPCVMVRDTELIKSIAIKNFDSFEDHLFFGDIRDPMFSKHLFSLKGDRWRDVRALLSPSFTSSKMKMMFHLISDVAVNFSKFLASLPPEKRVMDLKNIFTRYANDVIATCAFGISVNSMENPENEFYKYGTKSTNFSTLVDIKIVLTQHLPALSKLLNLKLIDDQTTAFYSNLIADTIRVRDEKGITRPDMLQLMMDSRGKREHGKELTNQDMTSSAFSFFLGGFETGSTVISFAAHELAVNPDIQEKLLKEITEVMENTKGQPSYEAINKMVYLDAVIKEVLRLYPPTPVTDRFCVKDFELPPSVPGAKPYLYKKGMTLMIPISGLHRDPNNFPEPKKFKPERFLEENQKEQCNLDAFIPFGLGPRMCIGNRFALLQTKILLFHLLAWCELKPCEKTSIPMKLKKGGFLLRPEHGFWLTIAPREGQNFTSAVTKEAYERLK